MVLLVKCAEEWVLLGICAEAGYSWRLCHGSVILGDVRKQGIAGQVCSSSLLLDKCAEAGYC